MACYAFSVGGQRCHIAPLAEVAVVMLPRQFLHLDRQVGGLVVGDVVQTHVGPEQVGRPLAVAVTGAQRAICCPVHDVEVAHLVTARVAARRGLESFSYQRDDY